MPNFFAGYVKKQTPNSTPMRRVSRIPVLPRCLVSFFLLLPYFDSGLRFSDVPLRVGYRNKGLPLLLQQYRAMLVKKLLHSIRNWLVLFVQLVVPVVTIILAMIINRTLPGPVEMPAFPLNSETYGKTTIPMYTHIDEIHSEDGKFLSKLSEAYKAELSHQDVRTLPDDDLWKYVVAETTRMGEVYFDLANVIGATFISTPEHSHEWSQNFTTTSDVTAYFNNQPYHGPAVTMNVMDNALLQLALPAGHKMKLTTYNHPLPPTKADQVQSWVVIGVEQFNIAFNLVFAMSFLISSFVVFLVKERVSKAKHLQLLGGVHPLNFWFATWTWDFFNYMLTVVAIMIVFVAFDAEPLVGGRHWIHILLLFIVYGWASLPMVYVTSFIFDSHAGAFVKLTIFNIFSGKCFLATNFFLSCLLESPPSLQKIFSLRPLVRN